MKVKLKNQKIAIIGLGYVGLPLAVEFSKKFKVVGYDIDKIRIDELRNGFDRTNEISKKFLESPKNLNLSYDKESIKNSNIYIITVPTPVDKNNAPDLNSLISATRLVARSLNKNDVVIYESTVFPGCTEELCVPILEEHSGLVYNEGFFCGYSPERINPGDKKHTIKNICKITSGSNKVISEFIDSLYKKIIQGGTYKASSIAVAEAAKVIENTQRDVNIALINELALIFQKLNLDTSEVLKAAETKWNFMPFKPGLVGGHCIGVDPYYLTYKSAEVGYHPEIILAGRRINDNMGYFIAESTLGQLALQRVSPIGAKVSVLGLTFKEDCPDLRNTKVLTIVNKLLEYKCDITISDEYADSQEIEEYFNLKNEKVENISMQDAIIVTVAHKSYAKLIEKDWKRMLKRNGILMDIKAIYDKNFFEDKNICYWRL